MPKPEPAMESAEIVVVAVPAIVVVEMNRSPPAFRKAHCPTPAPAESDSCGAVEEPMPRVETIDGVEVPMTIFPAK